jgi:nitrile hydratase
MKPYHDIGGNPAGAIKLDELEAPIFDQPWHKRVLGLTVAGGAMGKWSIDTSRFWRETLPKSDYQSFTYYEKWLAALNNLFVASGLISRDEIATGAYDGPQQPLHEKALQADAVQHMLATGVKASRQATAQPIFSSGQFVQTKQPSDTMLQSPGHTRLPHYVAGKTGMIIFSHGHHVLPNSNAHFLGECPEPLYSVEFSSTDLWPHATPGDSVIVDCWESYLGPLT